MHGGQIPGVEEMCRYTLDLLSPLDRWRDQAEKVHDAYRKPSLHIVFSFLDAFTWSLQMGTGWAKILDLGSSAH